VPGLTNPSSSGRCNSNVSHSKARPLNTLVIFDCDGVLVESERISHLVMCELLAEMDVQITYEDAILRFIGT